MASVPDSQIEINLDAADGAMPAFFRQVVSDHAAEEATLHPHLARICGSRLEHLTAEREVLVRDLPDLQRRETLAFGLSLIALDWWSAWKTIFKTAGPTPPYRNDGYEYLQSLHRALRWYYAGIERRKAVA